MNETWNHQLRVYLSDDGSALVRRHPNDPALRQLNDILARHGAVLLSQFDAFAAYVAEAEREGIERYPLYRWTKATLDDPEKRAKHGGAFAVHVGGREVYPADEADRLEADLRALVGGGVVMRMSRHDTNPANNLPVPAEFRTT